VLLVVADTGPINYLILIERIGILPALFEKVILPSVARDELTAAPSEPGPRGGPTPQPNHTGSEKRANSRPSTART
jgi:hypothetical protein